MVSRLLSNSSNEARENAQRGDWRACPMVNCKSTRAQGRQARQIEDISFQQMILPCCGDHFLHMLQPAEVLTTRSRMKGREPKQQWGAAGIQHSYQSACLVGFRSVLFCFPSSNLSTPEPPCKSVQPQRNALVSGIQSAPELARHVLCFLSPQDRRLVPSAAGDPQQRRPPC